LNNYSITFNAKTPPGGVFALNKEYLPSKKDRSLMKLSKSISEITTTYFSLTQFAY